MWLQWQPAVVLSIGLATTGLLARRSARRWPVVMSAFAVEAALVLALYALWQVAGTLSVMQVDGAVERGRGLWHLERVLHLPSEAALQRALLPHSRLVQASNVYYAIVHVPALLAFLVWLFCRHREHYPSVRNTLAFLTGACLLIQLVPVAPPRLVGGIGFVDTARLYGQSVYGSIGAGMADQLSAMPSVHVAWAVLIGFAVVRISPSRWRWVVLAHPILTALVVAATANHWWLDGVVAVVIMGLVMAMQRSGRAAVARYRARSPIVGVAALRPAER